MHAGVKRKGYRIVKNFCRGLDSILDAIESVIKKIVQFSLLPFTILLALIAGLSFYLSGYISSRAERKKAQYHKIGIRKYEYLKHEKIPMTDCTCMTPPFNDWKSKSTMIGIDTKNGRYGDVFIHTCKKCGSKWLVYEVQYEGFSKSGRWYRGLISEELAKSVTAELAVEILELLDWHIYGGAYFETSGKIGKGFINVD